MNLSLIRNLLSHSLTLTSSPVDNVLRLILPKTPKNAQENAIRQMIAAEVEIERIRRTQSKWPAQDRTLSTEELLKAEPKIGRSAELLRAYADINSKALTSTKFKTTSTAVAPVKKDFFGRPIQRPSVSPTPSSSSSSSQLTASPEDAFPGKEGAIGICYKYNEGFTNAIKRPIRIKDLFQPL